MFWAAEATSKKEAAFVPPPEGEALHLSQVTIGKGAKKGERVVRPRSSAPNHHGGLQRKRDRGAPPVCPWHQGDGLVLAHSPFPRPPLAQCLPDGRAA